MSPRRSHSTPLRAPAPGSAFSMRPSRRREEDCVRGLSAPPPKRQRRATTADLPPQEEGTTALHRHSLHGHDPSYKVRRPTNPPATPVIETDEEDEEEDERQNDTTTSVYVSPEQNPGGRSPPLRAAVFRKDRYMMLAHIWSDRSPDSFPLCTAQNHRRSSVTDSLFSVSTGGGRRGPRTPGRLWTPDEVRNARSLYCK